MVDIGLHPLCSMPAFFLSLVAIVMGSQQLLILPNDKRQYPVDKMANHSASMSQQFSPNALTKHSSALEEDDKTYLKAVLERLCTTGDSDYPNKLHIFALQAPIMFLSGSVVFFLAGLCSVVFAPLAQNLAWDGNAKVRTTYIVLIFQIPTSRDRSQYRSAWR